MSNALDDQYQQQICALGRLGWPVARSQRATGFRRGTISRNVKAAGIPVRPWLDSLPDSASAREPQLTGAAPWMAEHTTARVHDNIIHVIVHVWR